MNITDISKGANDSFELEEEPSLAVSLFLSETEITCLIFFLVFFGLTGFIQNLVVILSISLTDGFLDAPANIFVLSLACADILVCGVSAPLLIYNCYNWIFTTFVTLSKFIVVATTGSVFLMTVNCFISTIRPLKYSRIMTHRRAVAMVVMIWCIAILVSVLAIIGLSYNIKSIVHITRYFLIFYVTSSSVMYLYMYSLARKHRKELRKLKYAVAGHIQKFSNEFRALRSLFMVAGSFAVCWLPMTIGFFFTNNKTQPEKFYRTFCFTAPLAVINSILDPTIYYYRSKGFRLSLKTLWKRFQHQVWSLRGWC
ncbi:cannabinoid receptor 1-like [Dendronephthya gigantea]|uniref:cannabinoid receptor 1-like n=1 Tax=Dendronephthya gigantea TaxID=151771 RepID=UPI00106BF828|nr:cannabinoid receptor 1-like [Dendronephthya gigantea]